MKILRETSEVFYLLVSFLQLEVLVEGGVGIVREISKPSWPARKPLLSR